MPYVPKSIAQLLNISASNSIFPESWKAARATPIFKDGDNSELSNYRPISILPVLIRLFGKLIFNQLYTYLNENNVLSQEQSGFRALQSTASCLLKSINCWYSALDSSEIVGAAFITGSTMMNCVGLYLICQGKTILYG